MKYKSAVAAAWLMLTSSAYGVGLNEALTAAYITSEQLKAAQETFLGQIEAMPKALADFLPDLTATVGKTVTKTTNLSGAKGAPKGGYSENTGRKITLTQNLFSGGGDVAAVKAAQSAYRASTAQLYSTEQTVLTNALTAYMNVYATKEQYEISATTLSFYQKLKEAADEKLKVGEATVTDVAQATASLAQAEANKATAFANYEGAKALFVKTFCMEATDISLPEIPKDLPDTLDSLVAKTESSNFSVLQLKHQTVSNQATALSAKSNLLPSADFQASLGTNYYPYNQQGQGGTQYNNRAFTSGVSVTIPIFTKGGSTYSQIRSTAAQARGSAHQLADALTQVKAQAIGSFAAYQAAKSASMFSEQAVASATLALEGTKHEYDVGSKTILDVLNSQQDLYKAQIQKIQNDVAYITAAYAIKASIGQMTAKSLKLAAKYFNPGLEFRKVKAIVSF